MDWFLYHGSFYIPEKHQTITGFLRLSGGGGGGGRREKDQWHKMGLTNSLVRGHTLFKNHINNNFKKCHKMLVLLVITKDFKEIVFGLKLI